MDSHSEHLLRPKNRYTAKCPLKCKIHSVQKIGSNNIDRDFYHIEIDHGGNYVFREGQYCGILPPGRNDRELMAICIRVTRPEHETLGLCSRFLSECPNGTPIDLTGPFGKDFVPSDEDITRNDLVLIATGTGISSFRGFLKKIREKLPEMDPERRILLFFGVQNQSTFLYREELEGYQRSLGGALRIIPCFSREPDVPKCYVQVRADHAQEGILEHAQPLRELAASPRRCGVFVCGRTEMREPVRRALREALAGLPGAESLVADAKFEVYE